MTFWYDHGVTGWGWFAMSVGMILFWALIITAIVLVLRALNRPDKQDPTPAAPSPEEILGRRLARGEIDEQEYRGRLNELRSGPLARP